VELDSTGAKVFVDFGGKIFADTGNVPKGAACGKRFDVVREAFDVVGSPAISANSKRVRSLNFEEIGYLIEDERDLEIAHPVIIAIFESPGRRMSRAFRRMRP